MRVEVFKGKIAQVHSFACRSHRPDRLCSEKRILRQTYLKCPPIPTTTCLNHETRRSPFLRQARSSSIDEILLDQYMIRQVGTLRDRIEGPCNLVPLHSCGTLRTNQSRDSLLLHSPLLAIVGIARPRRAITFFQAHFVIVAHP